MAFCLAWVTHKITQAFREVGPMGWIGEVPLFVTTNKDRPEGCKIAVIPDHKKAKAHRGAADTRRSAENRRVEKPKKFLANGDFPGLQYPCPHPNCGQTGGIGSSRTALEAK